MNPTEQHDVPAPTPAVTPALARRLGVRTLDPATAPRLGARVPDGPPLSPTAYVGDSVLVRGLPGGRSEEPLAAVREVAKELGLDVSDPSEADQVARKVAGRDADALDRAWTSRVTLRATDDVAAPPDAWLVLQHLLARRPDVAELVHLEHVLSVGEAGAAGGMWGWVGGMWGWVGGMWGWVGHGGQDFGPGLGGRMPVSWAGPDPRQGLEPPDGAPVVAVLDTGLGRHPWFTDAAGAALPGVVVDPRVAGIPVGLRPAAADDPEAHGIVSDRLNRSLDAAAGHGTFVAGVVRQRCPSATLVAVPVLGADGAGREHDVLAALNLLAAGRRLADAGDPDGLHVDVVNLSLGYYHESPDLLTGLAPLTAALTALTDLGIAVVAAAGNGSTTARFLPAALVDLVPGLHSVGALNPDGATVALFSNGGAWVREHAIGAGVVSTVPVSLAGSAGRSVESEDPSQPTFSRRSTLDPDDLSSGFAVWSGTSFAAPRVAGDLAAALASAGGWGR